MSAWATLMPYVFDWRNYVRSGCARNNYCDSGDCVARASRVKPVSQVASSIRFNRKLEEVEWLLNYARNANRPIPVASAITTNKVSAPRRLTPMRLLNPVMHHQKTKSAHVPILDPAELVHKGVPAGSMSAMAMLRQLPFLRELRMVGCVLRCGVLPTNKPLAHNPVQD